LKYTITFLVLVIIVAQIHVHYFEDGNLQLQSSKSIPKTSLPFKTSEELKAAVISFIAVRTNLFILSYCKLKVLM